MNAVAFTSVRLIEGSVSRSAVKLPPPVAAENDWCAVRSAPQNGEQLPAPVVVSVAALTFEPGWLVATPRVNDNWNVSSLPTWVVLLIGLVPVPFQAS